MTTQIVTDEQLGKLSKRMQDLFWRVRTGGVDFAKTMTGLQCLSEKKREIATLDNLHMMEIVKWQKFYKRIFEESFDFSNILIPERPGPDWWLIILAKGMKPEKLFGKCREDFGAWRHNNDNLDQIVTSDRTAKDGHYAVWVKSNVEADEEFKNVSANQLKKQGHQGITLEERLVLELFYFWKTKRHLDIQNWTLCAGSRDSDDNVWLVSWYPKDDILNVNRCLADNIDDDWRSRRIVSS